MKPKLGLAWIALLSTGLVAEGGELKRSGFDLPHTHQEARSVLELNTARSFCEYAATGSLMGPPTTFIPSPSGMFPSIFAFDADWDAYADYTEGRGFCFY